jgi:hypothetical protein
VSERKALSLFGIIATLVAVIVVKGLEFLGADSETQTAACGLLLGATGLGGGFLFLHYQ